MCSYKMIPERRNPERAARALPWAKCRTGEVACDSWTSSSFVVPGAGWYFWRAVEDFALFDVIFWHTK